MRPALVRHLLLGLAVAFPGVALSASVPGQGGGPPSCVCPVVAPLSLLDEGIHFGGGVAVDPQAGWSYYVGSVEMAGDQRVDIVDRDSFIVVRSIPIGRHGRSTFANALAADPPTGRAWLSLPAEDAVAVIDGRNATIEARVQVGDDPQGVTIDVEARRVYVGNRGDATLSVIDADSRALLGTVAVPGGDHTPALDPRRGRVYVLGGQQVAVLDTASIEVVAVFSLVDPPRHHDIAVNPLTGRVYVGNFDLNTLRPFDPVTFAPGPIIGGPSLPWGIAVDASKNRIQVTSQDSRRIWVYDAANDELLHQAEGVGGDLHGLVIDPAMQRAHVLCNCAFGLLTAIPNGGQPVVLELHDPLRLPAS